MGFADHAAWWAMVIGAYAIIWFLALFMLLPVGLHNDADPPGHYVPGAPPVAAAPPSFSFRKKLLWATAIATAGWLLLASLAAAGVIQV